MLLITPWVPTLSAVLVAKRSRMETGNAGSLKYVFDEEQLYSIDTINGVPSGYVPAGLLNLVTQHLATRNITWTLNDTIDWFTMPDFTRIDINALRKGQDTALGIIASSYCGIIKAATGYGKSYIVSQLVQIFPTLNFVITTARVSVISTLYRYLCECDALAGQVGIMTGKEFTGPNFRITVCSIRQLHKCNHDKCDILIADECHNFGSKSASEAVAGFITARRFGLSASPKGRTDNADIVTEAMFGPILFEYSYKDAEEIGAVVPLKVQIVTVHTGTSKAYKNPTAVKRHGIWRNKERNEKIAAKANYYSDRNVLILCDTIEHLMHLKRLLPQAVIAYSNCSKERYERDFVANGYTSDPYVTKKDVARIQKELEAGKIKLCIATMIFKEGVSMDSLAVLIRTDGRSGGIDSTQIPGRLSRNDKENGKTEGILVDFKDAFDERLLKKSNVRIKSYIEKGWEVTYDDS